MALEETFFVLKRPSDKNYTVYKTREEARNDGALTLDLGHFIQVVFDFLLIAFCLFLFMQFFYFKVISQPEVTFPCPGCQESCKEKATTCPHCARTPISMQEHLDQVAKEAEQLEKEEEEKQKAENEAITKFLKV